MNESKDYRGESTRPRALTAKHVDALKKGEKVDLDQIEQLPPAADTRGAEATAATRPHSLNDDDVKASREGRDIGLDKRERLKEQKAR